MINIKEAKDCCGCWSCFNICPKKSITMKEDKEGFYYPIVNIETCIDCKLCEKVCPEINKTIERNNTLQKAFLLQIKDELIRKESTSGGAFTAIASWVINHKGIVYGAQLINTSDNWEVQHKGVETIKELEKFRNSKYVQSNIGNCFKEIGKWIKQERWVLFSGTPCQVEGLYNFFLGKHPEKLILIDVVCYGIPSPGLFRDYMNWKQHDIGGKFTKVLFREKRLCYNYTSFSIYNEDKSKNYHKGVESEQFMRSFFSNINIRPSCYKCKFKKRYHISDFTIWDCYDVKKFSKKFDDKGTNRVLIHSNLGEKIINDISPFIKKEQYHDIDYFIADEDALLKSVQMNPKRDAFFADYSKMDMEKLMQKWFPISIKIKINSVLRRVAFELGVYNKAKRIMKNIFRIVK